MWRRGGLGGDRQQVRSIYMTGGVSKYSFHYTEKATICRGTVFWYCVDPSKLIVAGYIFVNSSRPQNKNQSEKVIINI